MLLSQSRTFLRGFILAVVCLPSAAIFPTILMAQSGDFRIDTDVMETGKGKPVDQSVTLFANGVSYEYSRETPNQITVINTIENRVTLINTQRQVQSRVNLQELQAYLETVKKQFAQTATRGAEKLQDAAETSFDVNTQVVSAGMRFIRYDAKIQQPNNAVVAEIYANFANASAILNAWRSRGNAPPPFARLQLNEALREKAVVPTEIKRTIFAGENESSLISRIHITDSLKPSEKKQIEQYNEMILNYSTVALADYNNPNPPLSR
jgi:hypothetical protein